MATLSGMPCVVEKKKEFKDTLYGGVAASGHVLTPLVFSSDRADTGRTSQTLRVKYLKNIKGPGNKSTEIWWNDVGQEESTEDQILFLDNLKAHHSKTFLEEVHSMGVRTLYFPSHAGSILNPMDNSYWADFRASYYHEVRDSHGAMLDAIEKCYYRPSEEVITHYWRHCGFTSNESPRAVVERLLSEGYAPDNDRHQTEHDHMRAEYDHWSCHQRLLRDGHLAGPKPESLGFSGLDGVYCTAYTR